MFIPRVRSMFIRKVTWRFLFLYKLYLFQYTKYNLYNKCCVFLLFKKCCLFWPLCRRFCRRFADACLSSFNFWSLAVRPAADCGRLFPSRRPPLPLPMMIPSRFAHSCLPPRPPALLLLPSFSFASPRSFAIGSIKRQSPGRGRLDIRLWWAVSVAGRIKN